MAETNPNWSDDFQRYVLSRWPCGKYGRDLGPMNEIMC